MLNDSPSISVVIPVKNGACTLDATIQGILSQTLADRTEIIIIDSGSTDGTIEIARKYPVRIHIIPPETFNHGTTRNLGAELALGEFVVMTVQDARPVDNRWLETMLQHFDDPLVAGVSGRQMTPHDLDKNPLQWSHTFDEPLPRRVFFQDPSAFRELSGESKRTYCFIDDVTAMYRHSVLEEIPFRPVMFAEDSIWAYDALESGYALVYDPRATVYHYHNYSFSYRFRRVLTVLFHEYHFWNCMNRPGPWFLSIARILWHIMRNSNLTIRAKFYWIYYNINTLASSRAAYVSCRLALILAGKHGLELLHDFFCKNAPMATHKKTLYGK